MGAVFLAERAGGGISADGRPYFAMEYVNGVPLARTGRAVMTPAYAAPEQMRQAPVTTAADVYALGVVLYELLAGQRPFDLAHRSPADIERVVSTRTPVPPSTVAPPGRRGALRGDLDTICLKALRKEPERRYASAEQLGDDLQRYLDGLPVTARPDTAGYRIGKFLRRHRASVSAAVLVVVLIAGLVGFYTAELAEERDRARLEAATATQVSGFLQDLFERADPRQSGGNEPTARAARSHYEEALVMRRRLYDGPHPDVAHTLNHLGRLYANRGDYDAAELYAREAEALRADVLDDEHWRVAVARSTLGYSPAAPGRRPRRAPVTSSPSDSPFRNHGKGVQASPDLGSLTVRTGNGAPLLAGTRVR